MAMNKFNSVISWQGRCAVYNWANLNFEHNEKMKTLIIVSQNFGDTITLIIFFSYP